MTDWKALTGRISLFPGAPAPGLPSAAELYKQAWGVDPERFQTIPNALAPTNAQGKGSGVALSCSVHPTRIDFNIMPPAPSSQEMNLEFSLIEDTRQLHAELAQLIDFIGGRSIAESINRVAVYLHFLAVASNMEEANKILTRVMPGQYHVGITNEEDFILQINQPRMSREVPEVRMNYLTKWSTDRFQVLNVAIPIGVAGVVIPPPQSQEFIAATVTFDNNNTAAKVTLTGRQQSSLLSDGLRESEAMQKTIGLRIEGF